jgi:hypothetical protein
MLQEWCTVNIDQFCIVHPEICVALCKLWSHLEIPRPLGRHAEAGFRNFPAVRENCCRVGRFIFLGWNRIHKKFISCGSTMYWFFCLMAMRTSRRLAKVWSGEVFWRYPLSQKSKHEPHATENPQAYHLESVWGQLSLPCGSVAQ